METILITGANRGIGLELARQFLNQPGRVIATCRVPDRAQSLSQLKQAHSKALQVHSLEVTDEKSINALVDVLREETIDVLVNNAGVNGGERQNIQDMDYSAWMETFAINTIAPFRVTVALLDNLRRSRNPRVVTISSQMGSMNRAFSSRYYAYQSAKAAVNKVMQGLAADLGQENVIVCPVHPGWVQTDMGGAKADLTVQESALGLIQLISRLKLSDSGHFFKWNGEEHPW